MANDITVLDSVAASKILATKELSGARHVPGHILFNGTAEVDSGNKLPVAGDLTMGGVAISASVPVPVISRTGIEIAATMGTQTAGAYLANDNVDGILTLANALPVAAGTGWVVNTRVYCKTTQTGVIDVFYFHTNPSAGTYLDNGVFTLNATDMPRCAGVAHCADVTPLGTGSLHQASERVHFKLSTGTSLFALMVTRSGFTLGASPGALLCVGIEPTC